MIRLSSGIPVPGWTGLIVVVLLTSGTQLLILGTIGEYLWRDFEATRQRPPYVVETIVQPRRNVSEAILGIEAS